MLVVCWSPKGGSGTSVVVTGLALSARARHPSRPTYIVDLDGDVPAIAGCGDPVTGLSEWITQPSLFSLDDVLLEISPNLFVIPRGHSPLPEVTSSAWSRLALELGPRSENGAAIVVDCGRDPIAHELRTAVSRHILITRPCYLSLRRSRLFENSFDSVIVIEESHRVLTSADVQSVLGVPIAARIPLTSDIARRVDAGVIISRPPRQLLDALSPIWDTSR